MKFQSTSLAGAYLIEFEPAADERGFFAETQTAQQFTAHSLVTDLTECSISYNTHKATLRGMHYQVGPQQQTKLITCLRGAIHDTIIDLREDSPTYLESFSAELCLENRKLLYVPAGFAHGFLTLMDDCYVQYQISGEYAPDSGRGVRWNDPRFDLQWPMEPAVISDRDRTYDDFLP